MRARARGSILRQLLTLLAGALVVPWVFVGVCLRRLVGLRGHREWTLRHEVVFTSMHIIARSVVGASIDFIGRALLEPPTHWAPPGVALQHVTWAGRPAEILTPPRWSEGDPSVLYLHGGGYGVCNPASHRLMLAAICRTTGFRGVSLDYRMAPEDPFPAALNDARAAWERLCGETQGPLFVAGDSAGGGLTLALVLKLLEDGGRLPTAVAAMSPWSDLTLSGPTHARYAHTDYLPFPLVDRFSEAYVGDGDPRDPLISPAFGDFTGAPPVLIQYAELEVLRWDAEEVARRMEAAGVDVKADLWPGMTHVFQGFDPFIPEARWALRRLSRWLMERAESAPPPPAPHSAPPAAV